MEGIEKDEGEQAMNVFWIVVSWVAVIAIVYLSVMLLLFRAEDGDSKIQEYETNFWANKCHEAFANAQEALRKGDEYSFRKFAEQHALYYRRYKMARDGHFDRKPE